MVNLIIKLFTDGFVYLAIFLVLFLFSVLESISDFTQYKRIFSFFSFFFLTLFTGFRWETGTDWDSYKRLFDSIEFNWTFLFNVYSFDIGYVFFNAIVRLITNDYTFFLVIDSFIAMSILFVFICKYSTYPNLSIFLFYNSFFIAQFMGSNRRMIALSAVLFVFSNIFLLNRRRFFLWQMLAFAFHRTSLMAFLTWLIPKKRFSLKSTILILVSSLAFGISQLPFKIIEVLGDLLSAFVNNPIVEKMKFYSEINLAVVSENVNPAIQTSLSIIKRSIFLLFYLIVVKKNKGILDPLTDFFFNIYVVGFATYMLLNGSPIFQILTTYFTFIEVILIGRMWAYALINYRLSFLPILFVYGFFQVLSALNSYPELYMPYRIFFNIL
jgi:hypothetical protein